MQTGSHSLPPSRLNESSLFLSVPWSDTLKFCLRRASVKLLNDGIKIGLQLVVFVCLFVLMLFCTAQGCPHCIAPLTRGSIEVTLITQDQYARTYFQHTTTAVQGRLPAVILHAFMDYQNWFCFISSLYYCNITLIFFVIFSWTLNSCNICKLCSL